MNYANLSDQVITPEVKDNAIKTKGYFIYPSQLFINIVKTANTNENLNTDLATIFTAIESSHKKTILKVYLLILTQQVTVLETPLKIKINVLQQL